jgi:hypothetical protein
LHVACAANPPDQERDALAMSSFRAIEEGATFCLATDRPEIEPGKSIDIARSRGVDFQFHSFNPGRYFVSK